MSAKLSRDDYALLDELTAGPQTISGANPRDGADRLVAAGYATSRNLKISSVEYEISELGKIARVLDRHGVVSTRYTIEPHRHDDGLWHVKVTSEGNPALLMSMGAATKLMDDLRRVGADDRANDFEKQIAKSRRYAGV